MRRRIVLLCFAAGLVGAFGVGAGPVAASAPAFTVIDLGTLGGDFGEATAINNRGEVVGFSRLAGDVATHGFYWTNATGMLDLGTMQANSINDEGVVVGSVPTSSSGSSNDAAIWTRAAGMRDIGTLGGSQSYGMGADSFGRVFGDSDTTSGEHHAFMWTSTGGMVDLGTLGGPFAVVTDVSENGQVVGYSRISPSNGAFHAFRWTDAGGMRDLGTIGGGSSWASAVSETGQVAGYGYTAAGGEDALSWTPTGGMVDLGTLGGCCSQVNGPNAVSSNGQVVGTSYITGSTTDGPQHAFSWTVAGGLVDLGTLGGAVTSAAAVNSLGHVVGEGNIAGNAELDAFFWTPSSGIIDLGTLGGTESQAVAINDSDQIVGYADPADDLSADPVLWQPVTAENGSTTQTVSGGSTVTTDPQNLGATAQIPVQTSLTVPAGVGTMTVSVTAQPSTSTAPSGFDFFGEQVVIDNGGVAVPAASPYVVSFTVDSSLLGGIAPTDVQVFRDGVPAQLCTDPTAASPDPCVVSTSATADGDAVITVRTTHFSTWNVGRLKYGFVGFNQPVDNLPTLNTTKAGNAIPVKFSLGGNKGLNIFQSGYPVQGTINCQSGAPTDAIEQTVAAGNSSLSYDGTSNTYTYAWKTDKAWAGTCRELTVRFRDGTLKKADFWFSK